MVSQANLQKNKAMANITRKLTTLILILLCSCTRQSEQRAEFFVFGTLLEVVVRDTDPDVSATVFAALQIEFQNMHRDWHAWEPGELMRINTAFKNGEKIAVSPDIAHLIRRSKELELLTEGRFNPAVGGLIELWGFHTSIFPLTGPVPKITDINRMLEGSPSTNDIVLEGFTAYSNNPNVQLDFGAIAKGYAVDLAIDLLVQHGIDSALVNAGGDLRAVGGTADQPWRVGIRRPGGGVIGGIEIEGSEAVFTSGVDQRFLQESGTRYPHILDPSTGLPIQGTASVTVIASQGMLADAAATALMVAGRESWLDVVQALELKSVMLIDDHGNILMTPEMRNRLIIEPGIEPKVTVVNP